MNHFTSRTYVGAPDLNLLVEFAERAATARWPRSTYVFGGARVREIDSYLVFEAAKKSYSYAYKSHTSLLTEKSS